MNKVLFVLLISFPILFAQDSDKKKYEQSRHELLLNLASEYKNIERIGNGKITPADSSLIQSIALFTQGEILFFTHEMFEKNKQ
jgi:hypothetical protein